MRRGLLAAKKRPYLIDDGERALSARALAKATRRIQIEAMRTWWYEHFQDPVDCCPHDSGEGGYQYIYGGPYDPQEELESEFGGVVRAGVIELLAKELYDISYQWSGHPDDEMDEYEFAAITQSSEPQGAFERSMISTERLLYVQTDARETQVLKRLLYVNVIFAIETYLAAVLIGRVNADRDVLGKFVKGCPAFKGEKVSLSDVLTTADKISERVRAELLDTVWHRFDRVQHMFKGTLGVTFPADMGDLHRAVEIRHDIVHRHGATPKGEAHEVTDENIRDLIKLARAFVKHLEDQLTDEADERPEF